MIHTSVTIWWRVAPSSMFVAILISVPISVPISIPISISIFLTIPISVSFFSWIALFRVSTPNKSRTMTQFEFTHRICNIAQLIIQNWQNTNYNEFQLYKIIATQWTYWTSIILIVRNSTSGSQLVHITDKNKIHIILVQLYILLFHVNATSNNQITEH